MVILKDLLELTNSLSKIKCRRELHRTVFTWAQIMKRAWIAGIKVRLILTIEHS